MPRESETAETTRTPRAEETRTRILDAAEVVFAERGFDAATTREIASLSETNVATPYSYFASKEELYAAVIERAVAPLIELMTRFADETDKPGAAAATIRAVLDRLASHERSTSLIYREVVGNGPIAERLAATLFTPLVEQVCAELRANRRIEPNMEPFVASLFVHLSFSHVALAPLLSRVFQVDMLSPESLARQADVIGAAGLIGAMGLTANDE